MGLHIRPELSKEYLRQSARAAVDALGFQKMLLLSEAIERKLENLKEFRDSNVIATYVARADEVQTRQIIHDALARGKKVLVPLTLPKENRLLFSELRGMSELASGHFGILEPRPDFVRPIPLVEADVILVPVVAWDERGYRIGHGRGYFDMALAPLRGNLTIGLAFEAQRVDRVPEERHDIPLGMVVTESRILRLRDS